MNGPAGHTPETGPCSTWSRRSRRPLARPGTVLRLPLVERLARSDPRPIVSMVAPSGYGKTTLLAQWAERNGQSFAWVSVDENDNDPKVLLTYVAEAWRQPVGERVFDALASPASSVPGSVVPRLGTAFASMTTPIALVLDDVHILHNQECRAALSVLADHVPDRSRLVLAGRAEPPLRTGRLRAEGRILEIGPADLSLTREEAAGLLREAGVVLGADEVTELHRRTEGWPTGLYLAALYLREGGSLPGAAAAFGGDDRLVSEYVESEFLARIPERQRVFLTRTAVLDRMCGPLCEAVLERPGSGADLAGLARSNLLLVPLDRRGQWYRYHQLFREMLLAELERTSPALIPVLRRRAADWYLRNNLPEEALEYSIAASDVGTVGRLVEELMLPTYRAGRATTIQRWFRWLEDQDGIIGHPLAAVWVPSSPRAAGAQSRPTGGPTWWTTGRTSQAPDDNPVAAAWAAVLRALPRRHRVKRMRADADEAARKLTAAGVVAPVAPVLKGIAQVLDGDPDEGDACSKRHQHRGRRRTRCSGDWAVRAVTAGDGSPRPGPGRGAGRAGTHGAATGRDRRQLRHAPGLRSAGPRAHAPRRYRRCTAATGRCPAAAARAELRSAAPCRAGADRTRPRAPRASRRGRGQDADARDRRVLKRQPDLGTLAQRRQALRVRLTQERGSNVAGPSALTTAEVRVLPPLATHLSFREIGAELFLSQNTVKSQAISVYRKLAAANRSQAVIRAQG